MDKIRLGLIGLGYIGKVHLYNCLRLKSASLQAVSDISRKALLSAKRMGVRKTYTDYSQLLNDRDVDAVIIALPTHLHAVCVKEAAEAGKHIFLEKPLARNPSEGLTILSALNKTGIKSMVGYPLRFNPSFQNLKQKTDNGELGEIQIAYATSVSSGPFLHREEGHIPLPVPEWWFSKESTGGGALLDVGVHMINLLQWYFGEISNARSFLGHRFNMDVEDHAMCVLGFRAGQLGIITAGWFSQEGQIKVELQGTGAHASVDVRPPSKVKTAIQLMTRKTPAFYMSHFRELAYFTENLRRDKPLFPSAEEALRDLNTVSLLYKNQTTLDSWRNQFA